MEIDVIILSYAKNDEIVVMNNNCIDSINNSTRDYKFNIFLIETSTHEFVYPQENVILIQPKIEFGYNKFLNIGLKHCKNEWILISNNDIIYKTDFIKYMIEAHNTDNNLLSMCPMDDEWDYQKCYNRNTPIHYGYSVQHQLIGWSIFLNKKVIDIIGLFDENYSFWYQDNDYANTLIKYGIKHALITNSKIKHLGSRSNHLIDDWNKMVTTSKEYYVNKWK